MKRISKGGIRYITAIVVMFSYGSIGAMAASAQDTIPNHQIVLVKDLVQDMESGQWTDPIGDVILNYDVPARAFIKKGNKKGSITFAASSPIKGQVTNPDPYALPAVDVRIPPVDQGERAVRGAYAVNLPGNLKRVQLEVDYDLLMDDTTIPTDSEFYVEVLEKDANIAGKWNKTGVVKQNENAKAAQSRRVLEITDESNGNKKETYIARSYNADLSAWAGKEVKIALVSEAPANSNKALKGRWLQARLVGATFNIRIGE